jgi:hypothetical protein
MAAFNEYSDLPDPPQTTQSAALKASYKGNRSLRLMPSMLSRILLTYPMLLILLLIVTAPQFKQKVMTLYIILALTKLDKSVYQHVEQPF